MQLDECIQALKCTRGWGFRDFPEGGEEGHWLEIIAKDCGARYRKKGEYAKGLKQTFCTTHFDRLVSPTSLEHVRKGDYTPRVIHVNIEAVAPKCKRGHN